MNPRTPQYSGQFKKDRKTIQRSGTSLQPLDEIVSLLINRQALPARCRDHALHGDYDGYRDCHVAPDWVLIYKAEDDSVRFVRTGSHSELFA
ncbi:MAG: type II toxin-antitoxin system YafQ family toxin [Armatimonadetes bacterium]|nr:type II toxin-antitoxin system YafQ family toxin [Armatimonadota bacterium]